MMKKALALIACMAAAPAMAAEVSGTVGFTNDYRFHGISQTGGDPAIQGSLDVAFENGAYAGVWGSNVDFGDDANLEIDYYGGYAGSINDSLSYDVMLAYYTYPGYDAFDGDFAEVSLSLYYGNFGVSYAYAPDYFNSDENGQYISLNYSHPLQENLSLDLHAGRSFGAYWGKVDMDDYEDYSVGLSGNWSGLDWSAAYVMTSVESGADIDSGYFRNDDTLVLSISRTF